MAENNKAVILLSGGLDSTTALAIAIDRGFEPHALSFRYGQRHHIELDAAHNVARALGPMQHIVADIDLRIFGGSALTADIDVPKQNHTYQTEASQTGHTPNDSLNTPDNTDQTELAIPVTYVPARNTIFLSFALAWAEVLNAENIFIGVNSLDYSGYPDCRPEYIAAYEQLANLATKAGVEGLQQLKIHAPLGDMTKSQIIQTGLKLGVDYSMTHSCYDPNEDGISCGSCDSCTLRRQGFATAGCSDPLLYQV